MFLNPCILFFTRPSNDAYVNEILERPISGQVQRTGNQGLLDVKSLMPFSNVINKVSGFAALCFCKVVFRRGDSHVLFINISQLPLF